MLTATPYLQHTIPLAQRFRAGVQDSVVLEKPFSWTATNPVSASAAPHRPVGQAPTDYFEWVAAAPVGKSPLLRFSQQNQPHKVPLFSQWPEWMSATMGLFVGGASSALLASMLLNFVPAPGSIPGATPGAVPQANGRPAAEWLDSSQICLPPVAEENSQVDQLRARETALVGSINYQGDPGEALLAVRLYRHFFDPFLTHITPAKLQEAQTNFGGSFSGEARINALLAVLIKPEAAAALKQKYNPASPTQPFGATPLDLTPASDKLTNWSRPETGQAAATTLDWNTIINVMNTYVKGLSCPPPS
ncbi:MAG: hypothetical protein SFZ03_12210 [Candidatus Melainabacteria bacterium]|nr:hypothetical protein [Candidatus Melainabacteria bacterium]